VEYLARVSQGVNHMLLACLIKMHDCSGLFGLSLNTMQAHAVNQSTLSSSM
jgi:hypothetical protein